MKGLLTKFNRQTGKKPKFQVNNLVRVADLKIVLSKGDTNNWCYKFV